MTAAAEAKDVSKRPALVLLPLVLCILGIVSTFTLRPTRAHFAPRATQIFSSLTYRSLGQCSVKPKPLG